MSNPRPRNARGNVGRRRRQHIWNKSNGYCWYCGDRLDEWGWTIDHVIPLNGEKDVIHIDRRANENLVPCCSDCNTMKANYSLEYFRELYTNHIHKKLTKFPIYKTAVLLGVIKPPKGKIKFWFEVKGLDNIF